ncbi:MAG: 4'-phosphopantetheinyl transferase family protein [Flavipsychrobacter sp.]
MVVLCYTVFDQLWDEQTFEEQLGLLTRQQRERLLTYKDERDRQLRLQGKLLVGNVMQQLGITNYTPDDIKYDEHNRPYTDHEVDFNISHAGDIAVCGGVTGSRIGVDIENLKPINIADVSEVFSEDEWNIITNSAEPIMTVYKLWTRKEAVLKAAGKGMLGEPSTVNVSEDIVPYEDRVYNLYSVNVKGDYIISIATDKKIEELQVLQIG